MAIGIGISIGFRRLGRAIKRLLTIFDFGEIENNKYNNVTNNDYLIALDGSTTYIDTGYNAVTEGASSQYFYLVMNVKDVELNATYRYMFDSSPTGYGLFIRYTALNDIMVYVDTDPGSLSDNTVLQFQKITQIAISYQPDGNENFWGGFQVWINGTPIYKNLTNGTLIINANCNEIIGADYQGNSRSKFKILSVARVGQQITKNEFKALLNDITTFNSEWNGYMQVFNQGAGSMVGNMVIHGTNEYWQLNNDYAVITGTQVSSTEIQIANTVDFTRNGYNVSRIDSGTWISDLEKSWIYGSDNDLKTRNKTHFYLPVKNNETVISTKNHTIIDETRYYVAIDYDSGKFLFINNNFEIYDSIVIYERVNVDEYGNPAINNGSHVDERFGGRCLGYVV